MRMLENGHQLLRPALKTGGQHGVTGRQQLQRLGQVAAGGGHGNDHQAEAPQAQLGQLGKNARRPVAVGEQAALIDRKRISLKSAPYVESGRVMVPIVSLAQALDLEVYYDIAESRFLLARSREEPLS